ncbi:MAG: DUF4129 domain-containing protein [Chloroflexota bacterium]
MSKNQKRKLLGLIISVCLLMVILAISMPALEMKSGETFLLAPSEVVPFGSLEMAEEFNWLMNSFQVVMILLIILLPIFIILGVIHRDGKKIKVQDVFWVILILLAFTLPFSKEKQVEQAAPPLYSQPEFENLTEVEMVTPPPIMGLPEPWMFPLVLIAAAVMLAWISFLAYKFLSDRISSNRPYLDIADFAHAALGELEEANLDFEDVIIRCYAEMSQTVQDEQGIERTQAMTTSEFEQELVDWGFPARPVQQLTQLFEQVRYGRQQPLEKDRLVAAACLVEIIDYCREQA